MREEGEALQPVAPPQRLACIELGAAERATCATISPCGTFVACSSPEETYLFAVISSGGSPGDGAAAGRVARLHVPGALPPASALQFAAVASPDDDGDADDGDAAAVGGGLRSSTLLIAALDGRLLALAVDVTQPDSLAAAVEVPLPAEASAAEEARAAAQHTACATPPRRRPAFAALCLLQRVPVLCVLLWGGRDDAILFLVQRKLQIAVRARVCVLCVCVYVCVCVGCRGVGAMMHSFTKYMLDY